MGKGGGGSTTTVQSADPWVGSQQYLKDLYAGASNAYKTSPQYYPASTVAAPSGETENTLQAMYARSFGSPLEAQAQQQTSQIANGSDWLSQLMATQASGGGWQNQMLNSIAGGSSQGQQTLSQIMNGSDVGQGVLGALAQGGGASGQAYQNILSGNDATSKYLKSVLGGDYLNGNPYLSGMVSSLNDQTTRAFRDSVMPSLASQFSLAGRYGSGAQSQGIDDATNNLSKTLTDNATNIYGANYAAERQNQNTAAGTLGQYLLSGANGLQQQQQQASQAYTGNRAGAAQAFTGNQQNALGQVQSNMNTNAGLLSGRQGAAIAALPGMAALDWQNLQQRAAVGDYRDAYNQQLIDADKAKWDYNQQAPWTQLNNYAGILNGSLSLNGSTSNQTAPGRSPLSGALGGALSGAALGTIIPGVGNALGAGIGAGAGLLGII